MHARQTAVLLRHDGVKLHLRKIYIKRLDLMNAASGVDFVLKLIVGERIQEVKFL